LKVLPIIYKVEGTPHSGLGFWHIKRKLFQKKYLEMVKKLKEWVEKF